MAVLVFGAGALVSRVGGGLSAVLHRLPAEQRNPPEQVKSGVKSVLGSVFSSLKWGHNHRSLNAGMPAGGWTGAWHRAPAQILLIVNVDDEDVKNK